MATTPHPPRCPFDVCQIETYLDRIPASDQLACSINVVKDVFKLGKTKPKLLFSTLLGIGGEIERDPTSFDRDLNYFAKTMTETTKREVRVHSGSQICSFYPESVLELEKVVIEVYLSSEGLWRLQEDNIDYLDQFECKCCKRTKNIKFLPNDEEIPSQNCQSHSYCSDCAISGKLRDKQCRNCTKLIYAPQDLIEALITTLPGLILQVHHNLPEPNQEANLELENIFIQCTCIKCMIKARQDIVEEFPIDSKQLLCEPCFTMIEQNYPSMPIVYACPSCFLYNLHHQDNPSNCKMCNVHTNSNPTQLIKITQICILCVINQSMILTLCCLRLYCKNASCECTNMIRVEIVLPTSVQIKYKRRFEERELVFYFYFSRIPN